MELIKKEHISTVLKEIEHRFFDIPFENSFFQDQYFIINAEHSKPRQYRAIGLRLMNRINAVKEYMYEKEKKQIDVDEMTQKFDTATEFGKRRIQLELSKIKEDQQYLEKLLNDALKEISFLYMKLQEYPNYTREEFEQSETDHFKEKLGRQAIGITGALDSLANMGIDIKLLQGLKNNDYRPV
jgi:hypothetical protein